MLGGRAAEAVVYGEVSTGAQNDLQQATALARRMVAEFGMSALGLVAFDRDGSAGNGGPALMGERPWSERSAEAIDAEIKALLERNYRRALDVLERHRGLMDELAVELKAREEISGHELRARVAGQIAQGAAAPTGAAVALGA